MTGLRVLAVDDEQPALEDLAYLLRADPRIGDVLTARDGAAALKLLDRAMADGRPVEAVFLDIRMRGLDGVVLGRLLTRFTRPPKIVFVTAYDDHAVDAFELKAEDYLLKPVRPERLAEAIRRVCGSRTDVAEGPQADTIPVELGGVTRFVASTEVRYVEAQATTPGCTPRPAATWCAFRWPRWRNAGPRRGSCACTAAISSRSSTSTSCT